MRLVALTFFLVVVSAACRSQGQLQRQYLDMRGEMLAGHWAAAASKLERSKGSAYRDVDRVMYWLNLGTLRHYAGEQEASSDSFIRAEKTMRDLFTKSITQEVSRYVVSETIQDYPGEDYEKILVYLYTALNRIQQQRFSDALVEARRADELLKKIKVAREKEHEVGTLYAQDAFILWLVGLLYETEGSFGDAYLAFRDAHRTYESVYAKHFSVHAPEFLREDLVRSAELAGRSSQAQRWRERYGELAGKRWLEDGWSEVVLICGLGESPAKKEKTIHAPLPDGYIVRVALPEIVSKPSRFQGAILHVGERSAPSQLAEPVTGIAVANHEHRMPAITARAVARAAVKYAGTQLAGEAAKAAASGGGDKGDEEQKKKKEKRGRLFERLVEVTGNVFAAASEHADLRSWTTLPGAFHVARVWVPPGTYAVRIDVQDRGGTTRPLEKTWMVELQSKQRHFLSVRAF